MMILLQKKTQFTDLEQKLIHKFCGFNVYCKYADNEDNECQICRRKFILSYIKQKLFNFFEEIFIYFIICFFFAIIITQNILIYYYKANTTIIDLFSILELIVFYSNIILLLYTIFTSFLVIIGLISKRYNAKPLMVCRFREYQYEIEQKKMKKDEKEEESDILPSEDEFIL